MKSRIYIGEFANLNGITIKAVLHCHKIGLLPEPGRSPAGYRLYGPDEMRRMRLIRQLKSLGMNLQQIKLLFLGEAGHPQVLESLQALEKDILNQIQMLQYRLQRIRNIIQEEVLDVNRAIDCPPSFRMLTEKLGTDVYSGRPELMEQEKQVCALLDNFEWGARYQEMVEATADYFSANPEEYSPLLEYEARLKALEEGCADNPRFDVELEQLAREYALMIKGSPAFMQVLEAYSNESNPFEDLLKEMFNDILSPVQARFYHLCGVFFSEEGTEDAVLEPVTADGRALEESGRDQNYLEDEGLSPAADSSLSVDKAGIDR